MDYVPSSNTTLLLRPLILNFVSVTVPFFCCHRYIVLFGRVIKTECGVKNKVYLYPEELEGQRVQFRWIFCVSMGVYGIGTIICVLLSVTNY